MEIVEEQSAWLSNYEVYIHLKEQKADRDRIASNIGRPVRTAENVQTIEFEALEYFERTKETVKMTEERIKYIMGYLKTLALTKAEKLQIVNMLPTSEVEFYLIVEECEERFTGEQVKEVLDKITEYTT